MNHERACDLCGLDIGARPFYLENARKRLQFCCDGCLGIYRLLHETSLPVAPVAPVASTPASPNDTQPSKGEIS